jgi:hypothetical protein
MTTEEIKEIGEDRYNYITSNNLLKFGDIIENGWASVDSPRRFAIVVKAKKYYINCTDGKGVFWDLIFNSNSKIRIHRNTLNEEFEKFKNK